MTRPCASRTLLSSWSPWAMPAHAVGNLDPGTEPTWPRPAFRRSQLVPCAGQRYCAALAVRFDSAQRRRRPLAGFKEVSYYHRVTPCGLEITVHEGHPVRGGCLRDGSPTLGVGASATRTAGFGERPVLTQVRSMGPVDPVSHA